MFSATGQLVTGFCVALPALLKSVYLVEMKSFELLSVLYALLLLTSSCARPEARCRCTGNRDKDPACCWQGHKFVPNKLEPTPLCGWRSWQAFSLDVDQTIMEDTMRGLAKQRQLGGDFSSLAAAGYTDVGLDAGYEMIGKGFGGSCHTKDGHMLVNKTRFPDMGKMVAAAHGKGVSMGW